MTKDIARVAAAWIVTVTCIQQYNFLAVVIESMRCIASQGFCCQTLLDLGKQSPGNPKQP